MRTETEAPIEDSEEDSELISKSQLKRESQALQDLGKKLCHFNAEQLAKIPLDDKLTDAIALAHRLVNKRGALKRHYQYIGKILRNVDVEPIFEAVEAIENKDQRNKQVYKELEYWRERILNEGDPAINECCTQYPELERQQLRQLWRNHKSAKDEKKTQIARHLFRELQACIVNT
jgi:ribosome-associated protein